MKQDSSSALGAAGPLPVGLSRLSPSRLALLPLVRVAWASATLGAILVLATVVRVYNIVENPPGFFADEASFAYNAYTILHTGKDEFGATMPLFFKSFGEYKLPVYIYSQVPFIALLGLSELPVRLTSAAYGVATVAAVYFLMRVLFHRELPALATAAVLAISPWHIFYSRTGLGDILVHPFYIVLGIAFLVLGTKRPPFLLASGAAFVLALFSYRAGWVLTPPIIAVLILLYHRELIRNWRFSLPALAMVAVAGITILLHLQSVDSDRAQDLSIFSLNLSLPDTIKKAWENYRTQFTADFLFNGIGEGHLRHVVAGSAWIYLWQVPFLVTGMLACLWRPTRAKLLLLALLLMYPLPTASASGGPSSSHTFFGAIPFTLITGFGIVTIADLLRSWRLRLQGVAVGGALTVVLFTGTAAYAGVSLASFLDTYHGAYRDSVQGYWGWQWGAGAVMRQFHDAEGNYDELVLDGGAFNAADIFFRFYEPQGCPTCHIGTWDRYDPTLRQLYGIRPESLSPAHNFDLLDVLRSANGQVAFVIGEIADGPHVPPGALPNVWIGPPTRTMEEMQAAIEQNLNDPALYVDRGNLFWQIGKFWDAVYDYDKAIELDPNLAVALFNRGNLWSAVAVYDYAVRDFDAAFVLDPTLAGANSNIGDAYNRLRSYPAASASLNKAIQADPSLAIAYANRALAHVGLAVLDPDVAAADRAIELDLALADADTAIRLDPNLPIAFEARARIHLFRNHLDQALADFSRAIELNPQYPEAYSGRGITYQRLGNSALAVADLDRAVDLDRDHAISYAYRGLAYLNAGDVDRGIANLDRAIELDRTFVDSSHERNPQYQWSLQDLDETFFGALRTARTGVSDAAAAARVQSVIDYLTRSPE